MFNRLWTSHLQDPQEIERFERSLQASGIVLDRLIELLDDKEMSMGNLEISLDAYENPNWAYRQAHINGYKSCLKRIRKIIDTKETSPK